MKTVRIIHTNDIHSSYDAFLRMASVIKSLKTDHSFLLDAGDFNDFSNVVTKGSRGYAGLKLLNELGYEALTIGNNEGFQDIDLIEENCAYQLVHILSCNLVKSDDSSIRGLESFIYKTVNGVRFLIIGASPYYQSYNDYYCFHDIKAINPVDIVKKIMKENKNQYDCLVLLSHLGIKTDILFSQSVKGIDIYVAGHSHHVTDILKVNGSYMQQSGVRGSHVGYLDLTFDNNNKLINVSGDNIAINDTIPEDEEIKKSYESLKLQAMDNLRQETIQIPCDLKCSVTEECNFTNLVADYLYQHFHSDLALLNSGLTPTNLNAGTISYLDILPYCNSLLNITSFDIQGKYLIEAFRMANDKEKCKDSRRRPGYRGKYLGKLQTSYNCKIVVENENVTLWINGEKADLEKYYHVISTDYFARGMGYEILKNNIHSSMKKDAIFDTIILALKDADSYQHINQPRWVRKDEI